MKREHYTTFAIIIFTLVLIAGLTLITAACCYQDNKVLLLICIPSGIAFTIIGLGGNIWMLVEGGD